MLYFVNGLLASHGLHHLGQLSQRRDAEIGPLRPAPLPAPVDMDGGGAGRLAGLEVIQVVPRHNELRRLRPPEPGEQVDPLRIGLRRGLGAAEDALPGEKGAEADVRQGLHGDLPCVPGEDPQAAPPQGEKLHESHSPRRGPGLGDEFPLDAVEPLVEELRLHRRELGQMAEDVRPIRDAEGGADPGKVVHRKGERPIQVEDPEFPGENPRYVPFCRHTFLYMPALPRL